MSVRVARVSTTCARRRRQLGESGGGDGRALEEATGGLGAVTLWAGAGNYRKRWHPSVTTHAASAEDVAA
eukprot:1550930-Alexandrium_andersonii.AAC.1